MFSVARTSILSSHVRAFTFASPFSTFNSLLKSATKPKAKAPAKKASAKETKPAEKKKKAKLPYKKAISAYLFYNIDYHKTHKDQFKGVELKDKSAEISSAWNSLSDAAKAPFVELAEKDHERFVAEKAKYEASLPPKKPVSGYLKFYNTIRPELQQEHPEYAISELGKLAGERWRALSESQKTEYKSVAQDAINAWKKEYGAAATK